MFKSMHTLFSTPTRKLHAEACQPHTLPYKTHPPRDQSIPYHLTIHHQPIHGKYKLPIPLLLNTEVTSSI